MKQSKAANSACLYGIVSALVACGSNVASKEMDIIKKTIEKIDKNPAGGAAVFHLLATGCADK